MRKLVLILALAAVVYPLAVAAQTKKSNFSAFAGTWILDVADSESAQQDGSSAAPARMVISQNRKGLRVETVRDGKALLVTYPFKQESTPVGTTGSGRAVGEVRWEDGSFVTVTPYQVNGMAVTTIERRSLSPNGKEMTVVTTVTVQHGYQSGPNASTPLKQVFRRVR